jgi:hypothetical protein
MLAFALCCVKALHFNQSKKIQPFNMKSRQQKTATGAVRCFLLYLCARRGHYIKLRAVVGLE